MIIIFNIATYVNVCSNDYVRIRNIYSSNVGCSKLLLNLFTLLATSTEISSDGDYALTEVRVMLSANLTSECVDIHLVNDEIVEANETFLAHVEQIVSSDDLVFGLSPEFTNITIVDNDGKIIWMYI